LAFRVFRLVSSAVVMLVTAGALAQAFACGDGSDARSTEPGDEAGGPNIVPEGGIGTGDAGPPSTTMRLAHLASDLGPIDFCYRAANTGTFEGPVLGGGSPKKDAGDDAEADSGDDAEAGVGDSGAALATATVSAYVVLDADGPLTIAIVEGGASSCAGPIVVADVTLDPGKLSTVAVHGRRDTDASDALGIVAYTDDRSTVPEKARVRIVHAVVGSAGPIAVRAVAAQAILVADRVEPRRASTASTSVPVDDLGYATIDPVPPPASLSVTPAAAQDAATSGWQSSAGNLDLRGGSLHTGFVMAGEGKPYQVLWCTDTSTAGERTLCELVR
jgi:hypothetical protein